MSIEKNINSYIFIYNRKDLTYIIAKSYKVKNNNLLEKKNVCLHI